MGCREDWLDETEHALIRNHLKFILGVAGLASLISTGLGILAYAEGTFNDPHGSLNNGFKIVCDSGVLADRQVLITEDGEYNWMFSKGQQLTIHLSLNTPQNTSIVVYLLNWSSGNIEKQSLLHLPTDTIDWTLTLPSAGHWQLEMVNHVGVGVYVQVYVIAGSSGSLGLLNCLNPGDLFRND